jgi:hypothetical protein
MSPDIIKIDVQGAELKVLAGGIPVLHEAEVVIMEVSLIQEYAEGALFADAIEFMREQRFCVYDICTIWRNNRTMSMNEADVIFVRDTSALFKADHYC